MDEATFGDVTVELRMGTIVAQPDVGALMNAAINGAQRFKSSSADKAHEGDRRPIERFEASLSASRIDDDTRKRFYADNFVGLMGSAVDTLAA